jgi:hypothetical protein
MTTYYFEHVKNIARGMVTRYGGKTAALEECDRNIVSPLTTPEGQRFWKNVRDEVAALVVESPAPKRS